MKFSVILIIFSLYLLGCDNFSARDRNAIPSQTLGEGGGLFFDYFLYEFGNLAQDEVVIARFPFQNSGQEPVIIYDVTTGCGCTNAIFPAAPVAPGERGVVEVTFNTRGRQGIQRQTIVVFTSCSQQGKRLHLTANVK